MPEMRIWSILLIQSEIKWCIHQSRSLFLYLNKGMGDCQSRRSATLAAKELSIYNFGR